MVSTTSLGLEVPRYVDGEFEWGTHNRNMARIDQLVAALQAGGGSGGDLGFFTPKGRAGFDPTGTTDSTAAFVAAATALRAAGRGTFYVPAGRYILTGSVPPLPADSQILFEPGAKILTRPGGAGFVRGYVFLHGTTDDGMDWSEPYANFRGSRALNIQVDNSANPSLEVRALLAGSSIDVRELRGWHTAKLVGTVSQYLDFIRVNRAFVSEPVGAEYQIELSNLGDGAEFSQIGGYLTGGVPNILKLYGCQGGLVSNPILGNYLFEDCRAITVCGGHVEEGMIEFDSSDGEVRGTYFWAPVGGPRVKAHGGHRAVALRNLRFVFRAEGPWPATPSDIDVEIDGDTVLTVEDCFRVTSRNDDIGISELGGIRIASSGAPLAAFNDRSYVLSRSSRVGPKNTVRSSEAVDAGTGDFWALEYGQTTGDVPWREATGTYYYQCQLLLDPARGVGISNSAGEKSLSLTAGGDGALLPVGFNSRTHTATLRLYRGTAAGNYSHFVDIPMVSMSSVYDDGILANGYPWHPRSPGAMDAIMTAEHVQWEAGRATVSRGSAAVPSAGTWAVGDRVLADNPVGGTSAGYLCVLGGSPGTWRALPQLPAT